MENKKVIIIGAGPAGLAAAYDILKTTNMIPVIYEKSNEVGGISTTKNFDGNHMDLGGHRFFSKSDTVMNFFEEIMPFSDGTKEKNRQKKVFLLRNRISRILYNRKFFDYPISVSIKTFKNLGIVKTIKIGCSYFITLITPKRKEKSLEDFFINRFGKELYKTFFKDYTEKVWGLPCDKISPDWGAQRVKNLSIIGVLKHAILKPFRKKNISQKDVETTLIEKFLYPKRGPGEFWQEVANFITENGGKIYFNKNVVKIKNDNDNFKINSIEICDEDGKTEEIFGDYFISSMPVRELVDDFEKQVPKEVKKISDGLVYRDFITVGLLLKQLRLKEKNKMIRDNWIYIQENDVKLGRIQLFNNWSPFMVKDRNTFFLGLEYFCNEGDYLYNMSEEKFIKFAINEVAKLKIINKADVLETHYVKVLKAYPAYFGSYENFDEVKNYLDKYTNLFLVGRNGQHKYNNMDHSILTSLEAVKNIRENKLTKDNIWGVNSEKEYHETKK